MVPYAAYLAAPGECEVEPAPNLSTVASFYRMPVGGAATNWVLSLRGGEPQ